MSSTTSSMDSNAIHPLRDHLPAVNPLQRKTLPLGLCLSLGIGVVLGTGMTLTASADEYQWLEAVESPEALAWVAEQNQHSLPQLMAHPMYDTLYESSLEVLNSDARIPSVTRRGDYLYNLWRDAEHPRGLYRRTTLDEYRQAAPAWETILDLDALADAEQQNWTWGGIDCLYPDYDRCLVSFSVAGSDAVMVREYSIADKAIIRDGFSLPETKSDVTWLDENTIAVGTDLGPGSMTDSGYPAQMRRWQRGQPLEDAPLLFSVETDSVSAFTTILRDGSHTYTVFTDSPSFFERDRVVLQGDELVDLEIPNDSDIVGLFQGDVFVELRSDWDEFPQGAIIHAPMADLLGDSEDNASKFQLFVTPGDRTAINSIHITANAVLVNWLDNVRGRLTRYTPSNGGNHRGRWEAETVAFDPNGAITPQNTSFEHDDFFVSYQSFTDPTTLYHVGNDLQPEAIKRLPEMFDAANLETLQYMATSADGTQVPYFVVMDKDAPRNGQNPVYLFGYGGFEISYGPYYSPVIGRNWLEHGGVYVLANIRGGGEFGPSWHQAALLKNRHKAYEDFEAVAEDLIARNITSPDHLGIRGGSNGGLLVAASAMRRPELFNAVLSQVPLLDMQRYHLLLAGASWMGEYGNPDDPDMWEYMQTYSPYHNIREDEDYPLIFFTTSTRDDRVHPAHARKMVAKMRDMGHDVLYYENTEGGHSGAANNEQRAQLNALMFAYMWDRLGSE